MHTCTRAAVAALLLGLLSSGCTRPTGMVRSPEPAGDAVIFRYRAPAARVVQLSGSWESNFHLRGRDWSSDTRVGVMQRADQEGVWELRVELPPGRYEYLFLVDGRFWELDPVNPQRAPDGTGGFVSLVVVP